MDQATAKAKLSKKKTANDRSAYDWLKVLRLVMLSRELDRLEVEKLAPEGKVKYQFSAGGHELAQVLLALHMDHPHDAATVYYRSRPFLLASGLTPVEALAAGMARRGSPSEGRDVGVVFNMPRRTGATVLPSSGDVGAQYTPAAGWAQAILYRQRVMNEADWQGAMAAATGGESSTAANGFWAALNMTASLDLPLLFFIEDNGYGISVPGELQTPGGNIAENLKGFKCFEIFEADGWDPESALGGVRKAVERVRSGKGPALLRMRVARLLGHTFIDDQAYKTAEQRELDRKRDPLEHLKTYLLNLGYAQGVLDELEQEVVREVREAAEEAETYPPPNGEDARRYAFFEGMAPDQGGLRPEGALLPMSSEPPRPEGARIGLLEAVRKVLSGEMERNRHILVFGEDVGVKGGVHGATAGMQKRFGAERVFDTSLSEEGIMGRAVGMALAGLLPVPEIQFRKYADPAHEQISDLGTLRWRTANHFAAPVVVRIPVGYGRKTGDPWHSVTGEAIYAHMTGWRIAFPSNAEDAAGLMRTALRSDDPTFFFEHRALLDAPEARRPYPGNDYCLPFGKANRLLEGDELLVVTWGEMVYRCLEAAKAFGGRVRLLDLRTISPWDREQVMEGVKDIGKALIVHEDGLTGGFGAEIAATIMSEAFEWLDAPVERMAAPDVPVPYSLAAMEALLPGVGTIRSKMEWLLSY